MLPVPQGKRSGAVGLLAAAVVLGLFVAPGLGAGLSELAFVAAIGLAIAGMASWQRNRTDPRGVVAELDRERQRRGERH
jgi:hypothetical protein